MASELQMFTGAKVARIGEATAIATTPVSEFSAAHGVIDGLSVADNGISRSQPCGALSSSEGTGTGSQ